MPARIANYASQQTLNTYLRKIQQRLQNTQVQISSEKKSQDYTGIGVDTQRLVGYEVDTTRLQNYVKNNNIMDIQIKSTETAMDAIQKTVSDFRHTLLSFNAQTTKDENAIRTIQEQAFRSMQAMQGYLNSEVNGRFIFAGGRGNTSPVDIGVASLEQFQARYDGVNITYPTTLAQQTENFNFKADSAGQTNWLKFLQDDDGNAATAGVGSITANTAQFTNVTVGGTIEVTGTANNNGVYMVKAITNGGKTIQIQTAMLTNEANVSAAVLKGTDGTTLSAADFTDVTFNRAAGTIVPATGTLAALKVGSSFTVSGTTQNDGTYLVESNSGTSLKIKEVKLTDEGTAATPTLNFGPGNLTFTTNGGGGTDTIAGAAGTFSALSPGMKVTIGGTASNNGTVTVASVSTDGSTINVVETLTTEAATGNETAVADQADGTVKSVYYYKGDTFARTHHVAKNREIKLDLNGADPAFEKAFRAMGMVAQGKFGTVGGLGQPASATRLNTAVGLLDLSLNYNDTSNPQYDANATSSIESVFVTLGYQRSLMKTSNETHTRLVGFFDQRVAELENVNKLDAITQFLNDQKALEASYQAMASISKLSLYKYLS